MKCVTFALLAAFAITASAGTTIKCPGLGYTDPLLGLNVGKGGSGNAGCKPAREMTAATPASNLPAAIPGKPSKDQRGRPEEATTVTGSGSNSDYRTASPAGQAGAQDSRRLQGHERQLRALTMSGESPKLNEHEEQRHKPLDSGSMTADKPTPQQQRTARNPTVTQGLKVSREMAPDTNVGPAASPKGPVPKVDSIHLNSSRSNIYRKKTTEAVPGKDGSIAEPEKPFKF